MLFSQEKQIEIVPAAVIGEKFCHLQRCLKNMTESCILLKIIDLTARAKGSPRWAVISMADFAVYARCTEDTVIRATDALEKCGLIASEKAGRNRKYRCLFENWSSAPMRPMPIIVDEVEELAVSL